MISISCQNCQMVFGGYPSDLKYGKRYCSMACKHEAQIGKSLPSKGKPRLYMRGVNNPRWNGGRTTANGGYIMVKAPDGHPRPTKAGYIRLHRLVMEQKIGRYLLPSEDVDHKNGIKTDNRPENLQIISRSEHVKLEHTRGVYKEHLEKLNNRELQHA